MWVLLIFLGIFLALIVLLIVLLIIEKSRETTVGVLSTKLKAIEELNSNTHFQALPLDQLSYTYHYKTKKSFDYFEENGGIRRALSENKEQITSFASTVNFNNYLYDEYMREANQIPSTDVDSISIKHRISPSTFHRIEDKLFSKKLLNPQRTLITTINWNYSSPKGYANYSESKAFSLSEINNYFLKNFGIDLVTNAKNNVYTIRCFATISTKLTENVYSDKQIIKMFEECGSTIDKTFAREVLLGNGYKKSERAGIYTKSGTGTLSDMILNSADENGIIAYDNKVKDDKYDLTIADLESKRRILPISNLSFLKIDENNRFGCLTMSDINYFDFLIRAYSEEHEYFSVKMVFEDIKCPVTSAPYENCFVLSLLKTCGFLTEVYGLPGLFTENTDNYRFNFLKSLIKDNKSTDAYELIYNIKEQFGIDYSIYSIIYDIKKSGSSFYYNEETEKIYLDKKYFYEEIL